MTDARQFEAFMRKYQDMVFSTAMRLLANPAEAEDVSQDVFLKAYNHFEQIQKSPTAGGWLKTVATNLSLNHLSRYRSRWRFFSEFLAGGEDTPEAPDFPAAQSVAEDVERADRRSLVESALHNLPSPQRVPLVLFHFEGLSYEEIADKLGISIGKVKTDIFRGRQALRRELQGKVEWQTVPPA